MTIFFSATTIPQGKRGVMKPDARGYYRQVVGGLNAVNSRGEYYTATDVLPLFEANGTFMRRVRDGVVKGEVGHPYLKPGMTERDFYRRIMTIQEDNVCCFFTNFELNDTDYKNQDGSPMIAIIADVAPSGPHGDALRQSFEREGENVCFSIRSFTSDRFEGGRNVRTIKQVVTFDWVTEPGIHIAKKFQTPGLEHMAIPEDIIIRPDVMMSIAQSQASVGLESAALYNELITAAQWKPATQQRKSAAWQGW